MNLQDLTRESKRRFGNMLCQVYPTLRGINTDDAIALLSLPRQVIENIAKAASESPVKLPEECRIPIPEYEHDLGPFEVIFRDPFCGEPVAWGFRIVNELQEGRFGVLADYIRPLRCECISEKDWAVITYELTPEKAVKAYGDLRIVEHQIFTALFAKAFSECLRFLPLGAGTSNRHSGSVAGRVRKCC